MCSVQAITNIWEKSGNGKEFSLKITQQKDEKQQIWVIMEKAV